MPQLDAYDCCQVKEPVACSLDRDQLDGYCCACGAEDVSSVFATSLLGRVESSKKHAYQVGLLSGKVTVDNHSIITAIIIFPYQLDDDMTIIWTALCYELIRNLF